jgi:hypothetical protein
MLNRVKRIASFAIGAVHKITTPYTGFLLGAKNKRFETS